MYNITREEPKTGQYVAMWEHKGVMWSETFKWVGGTLFIYDNPDGEWVTASGSFSKLDLLYIQLVGEDNV